MARRAFDIAIVLSLLTAVAAGGVGLLAGSLVVLAVAGDKLADALMSLLNRWAYGFARQAPDEEHPWGHGKVEAAMSFGQALFLVGIVVAVVAGVVDHVINPAPPTRLGLAMVALVVVGVVSVVLTFVLERAARAEASLTLAADAAHYRVDALHTAGGLLGLALVWATDLAWLDPLAGLVFAVLMSIEAWRIGRRALGELLDEALPDDEVAAVQAVLDANRAGVLGFHGLRTRKAGPQRFVEVHAELEPHMGLADAHQLVQSVGAQVAAVLPDGARVLVHPDAGGLSDRVDHVLES